MDNSSADISKFLKGKKDIIIISDVEGFCPKEQIAKIIEYASSDDKSKGVIFNGDVLDYTVGIEVLGAAHPDNLCALRLLKVLTNGMKAGNVICNIGNRDINKIKLLALLQAEDNSAWWESGENISDIAENLQITYHEKPDKFWKFNDLRSINPFWNKANPNFSNERWLPATPIITKSLLERFKYIFGDDPGTGTISAKNNLDGIPRELGINTLDKSDKFNKSNKSEEEYQAAIVFTVFARMLFMKPTEPRKLEQDGLLAEYLALANVASYAVLDKTLLLFAHGGFTKKFFDNKDIIVNLRNNLQANASDIDKEIMAPKSKPKPQTGGTFESKMDQILFFNAEVKYILKVLFTETNQYIRRGQNGIPFLNEDLMILTILSTPATNNAKIAELVEPYETALSPIQIGSPIGETLYNSIDAAPGTDNISRVINIFSHIPKGFGYSFGKSGEHSYFINTDFSNTLLKNRTYLKPIETNPSYLFLHLENTEPSTRKWQFRLDGTIEMDISTFDKSNISTDELDGINKLNNEELKKRINKDTILTDSSLKLNDSKLTLKFSQSFSFAQLDTEMYYYPTKNLFYHGLASINGRTSCKVYSVNGIAPPFAKYLYLMPSHVESAHKMLGTKGGRRRQSKLNKSNKSKRAVRKSNKRIQDK
jgi:hypothetical protein